MKNGGYLVKSKFLLVSPEYGDGRPLRGYWSPIRLLTENSARRSRWKMQEEKIAVPKEMEGDRPSGSYEHLETDLDTNLHVCRNNAQYVDIARELAVPAGTEIGEIRAGVRPGKRLCSGDEMVIKNARKGEGRSYLVSLCNSDGDVFANVELREKEM